MVQACKRKPEAPVTLRVGDCRAVGCTGSRHPNNPGADLQAAHKELQAAEFSPVEELKPKGKPSSLNGKPSGWLQSQLTRRGETLEVHKAVA